MLVTWKQYSKVSDEVFSSNNISVKMNVNLYRDIPLVTDSSKKRRKMFHTEFSYKDKEGSDVYSIHRSFDFYLSIENTTRLETTGYKEFIRIGLTEIDNFRLEFANVFRWIHDPDLFVTDSNGKLYLNKNEKPIFIGGLPPKNKFIAIEPAVGDSDSGFKAMKIVLNSQSNVVMMPLSKFMGFYHVLMNINLYNAAQNIVNYFGRPSFGSNLYTIGGENNK